MHGSMRVGPWERSVSSQRFFGLVGEYRIQGGFHARELSTWVHPQGYATRSDLEAGMDSVNYYIGLTGTMSITIDGNTTSFLNCEFEGVEMEEEPWLDGSGVNGWQVRCQMKFRQIQQ